MVYHFECGAGYSADGDNGGGTVVGQLEAFEQVVLKHIHNLKCSEAATGPGGARGARGGQKGRALPRYLGTADKG